MSSSASQAGGMGVWDPLSFVVIRLQKLQPWESKVRQRLGFWV